MSIECYHGHCEHHDKEEPYCNLDECVSGNDTIKENKTIPLDKFDKLKKCKNYKIFNIGKYLFAIAFASEKGDRIWAKQNEEGTERTNYYLSISKTKMIKVKSTTTLYTLIFGPFNFTIGK